MTRLVRILDAIHARLGRLIAVLEACEAVAEAPTAHPARGSLRVLRCSGCGCTYRPSWKWPGHETHCGACARTERPS